MAISLGEEGAGQLDSRLVICSGCDMSLEGEEACHLACPCIICSGRDHLTRRISLEEKDVCRLDSRLLGNEGADLLDSSCFICSGYGHLTRERGSWSLG